MYGFFYLLSYTRAACSGRFAHADGICQVIIFSRSISRQAICTRFRCAQFAGRDSSALLRIVCSISSRRFSDAVSDARDHIGEVEQLRRDVGWSPRLCIATDFVPRDGLAPGRSALLMTKISAISIVPALMACTSSPIPGTRMSSVTSARPRDLYFILPDPDSFDEHEIAAGCVEKQMRVRESLARRRPFFREWPWTG